MKKILIFSFLTILVALTFVYFLTRNPKNVGLPSHTSAPSYNYNFKKDYSALNKTRPGKSSTSDVVGVNGQPTRTSKKGDQTFFYYITPSKDYINVVAFKNNVETYAIENIFDNYRGNYSSFKAAYGNPDLLLYEKYSPYQWSIFLIAGVGIEANKEDITKILYFVPQSEENFIETVSKELSLSKENSSEVPHP